MEQELRQERLAVCRRQRRHGGVELRELLRERDPQGLQLVASHVLLELALHVGRSKRLLPRLHGRNPLCGALEIREQFGRPFRFAHHDPMSERPRLSIEDRPPLALVVERRLTIDLQQVVELQQRRFVEKVQVVDQGPSQHGSAAAIDDLVGAVELRQPLTEPPRHVSHDVGEHEVCVLVEDDAKPVAASFSYHRYVVRILSADEQAGNLRNGFSLIERLERCKRSIRRKDNDHRGHRCGGVPLGQDARHRLAEALEPDGDIPQRPRLDVADDHEVRAIDPPPLGEARRGHDGDRDRERGEPRDS